MYSLPSFNSYQLKANIFSYISLHPLFQIFLKQILDIILLIKFSLYIFKWLKNNHNTVTPWNTHSYSLISLDIQSVFTYPQMFNWFVSQKLFILKKKLDLSKVSVFQWLYQLSPLIYRFPFPALSLCLSVSLEFIWRNWVIYFIGFFKIWILLVISLWCFSHILWPFMLLGNW